MATKRNIPDILQESAQKNDWQQLAEHVKANPVVYALLAVFLLLVIVVGGFYRISQKNKSQQEITAFARALLDKEKPAERAVALEPLAKGSVPMTSRALLALGTTYVEAKEYEKAKEALERLRQTFPTADEVPDAVESLGFIAENAGDYEKALAAYKEVVEKWPTSFTRRHQDVNIGRCLEKLNKLDEAVKAYQALIDNYAGSGFEPEARQALDRLRSAHPELFPKPAEEAKATEVKPGEAAAVATPAPTPAPDAAATTPATTPAPAPQQ